jgi:hypothetical protein
MSEDQGVFVANTVFVDQTGTTSCRWADPQILYKYRQPSLRALESLTLSQVWFAQPKTFNDPFESSKFMAEEAVEQMIRQTRDVCAVPRIILRCGRTTAPMSRGLA